jgi:hypothetical protein
MATAEDVIQDAIVRYLRTILPRAITFAVPNGRTKVSGITRGAPDLCVALPGGGVLWFEVKTKSGVVDREQKAFHARLVEAGHLVAVVRSIDDVRLALNVWGVLSREAA